LEEAASEPVATAVANCCARPAVEDSVEADASSSVAADDTVSTISPIAASKPLASLVMSALRCASARRCTACTSSRLKRMMVCTV